jgi:hypothetical protein
MDFLLVLTVVILFAGVMAILKSRTDDKLRERDFMWYSKTYPNNVQKKFVICHKCNGERVHTRTTANNSSFREHFCPKCGETLYYSEIKSAQDL